MGGGKNLLEKFYKDPKRWAYTFEMYTFMTRMKQAFDADKEVMKDIKQVQSENQEKSEKEETLKRKHVNTSSASTTLQHAQQSDPKNFNENFSSITFFERSVYSSRLVFAENSYESGVLSDIEWGVYCDWSNYLIKKVKALKLDGIIYLRCDPEVCIERMKKRNRSEENTVPADYLKAIHMKNESWLNDWMKHQHDINSDTNLPDYNQTT